MGKVLKKDLSIKERARLETYLEEIEYFNKHPDLAKILDEFGEDINLKDLKKEKPNLVEKLEKGYKYFGDSFENYVILKKEGSEILYDFKTDHIGSINN